MFKCYIFGTAFLSATVAGRGRKRLQAEHGTSEESKVLNYCLSLILLDFGGTSRSETGELSSIEIRWVILQRSEIYKIAERGIDGQLVRSADVYLLYFSIRYARNCLECNHVTSSYKGLF